MELVIRIELMTSSLPCLGGGFYTFCLVRKPAIDKGFEVGHFSRESFFEPFLSPIAIQLQYE